jgi:hypothetical protein
MIPLSQMVKGLESLDLVTAAPTVFRVGKNVLGRCLCAYRTDSISFCSEEDRLKFILPTFVGIIRLPAAIAEQLHFLRVRKTNLRLLFHRMTITGLAEQGPQE